MMKVLNCRLCFDPVNNAQTSLKETLILQGARICISTALSEMFPALTKLQCEEADDSCLPQNICTVCLQYLDISYKFWSQCVQANETILNLLKEHKTGAKGALVGSKHSQYNLEHCQYYRNSNSELYTKEQFNINIYTEHANEIVIDELSEGMENTCDSSLEDLNSQESFFKYLHLKVRDKSLNSHEHESENSNKLTWKDYFKTNSTVLCETDKIYSKLEHSYAKQPCKFHCVLCKNSFATKSVLKIHFETYHTSMQHHFAKYKQKCISSVDLVNHLHNSQTYYKCKVCNKHCLSLFKFEIHVKRNHNGYEPFQCNICSKSFVIKSLLLEHEKLEHSLTNFRASGKRLVCPICSRTFASKGGLEWHTEVKHGPKIIHECDICLTNFSNRGTLTKHMKRHRGFKPLICVHCDKECPSMVHLQEHIKIKHQTHSTYICELCDKNGFTESELIAHIESHTGES